MRRVVIACLALTAVSVSAQTLYKCEVNGRIEYSDKPCPSSNEVKRIVPGGGPTPEERAQASARAQREISNANLYRTYQVEAQRIGRVETKGQARNLAHAAMISQNPDAVDDALRALSNGKSSYTSQVRLALEECKLALQRGEQCDSRRLPEAHE